MTSLLHIVATALVGAFALGAGHGSAFAAAADNDAELSAFQARFKQANPGTRVDAVSRSPVPGVFEVQAGKNLIYVDASARYAFLGSLFDFRERRDLSADRLSVIDRIDTSSLPKSLAIKSVRGTGKRTLYVFADPQCGWCRQQEQHLQSLDDVTIYTFVVSVLGPDSKKLADAIGCSQDPARAWSAWMGRNVKPDGAPCRSPSDAVDKLAKELGVEGTPTLVAADGRKNVGALSGQALQSFIAASPSASPALAGAPTTTSR